jgi:hypothetical protein
MGETLGCVSFTTPERDNFIRRDPATLAAVQSLKNRYLVGLHHNWHDFEFVHDPLFDFSMAGEADLIERSGKVFARTPIDCCNFVPQPFFLPRRGEAFWDVINVTREAFFKNQAEFLQAVRAIYDRGRRLRVLHLCPVPRARPGENPVPEIRRLHEELFSVEERRTFTLMTMDWDHPRPLDLDTLAFFYRAAKVFVHTAHDERRCRIAAYAWASQMPVVARDNVASILSAELRREPFYFGYQEDAALADAILAAVEGCDSTADWAPVLDVFRPAKAAAQLDDFLQGLAEKRGRRLSGGPINPSHMDFRLGRHHMVTDSSPNLLPQTVAGFCEALLSRSDADLAAISRLEYPEDALLASAPRPAPSLPGETTRPSSAAVKLPSWKTHLRTWLRRGHRIPLTGYRVVIDLFRDP